jgi:hypothetical protein
MSYIFGERRVLLKELNNAIRQLRVIHAQTLHLMQRNQDASQEQFMLLLQRQRKAVDDRSHDFQQFCNPVKPFSLVGELKENIINRSSDI